MANGDPLLVGLSQPPDNRASSTTMLVHNGSVFGDQSTRSGCSVGERPLGLPLFAEIISQWDPQGAKR